jgi:hypothetical protein
MHRVVVERLGAVLTPEIHVHHMDFDKWHNCPSNLLICPAAFNPSTALRDPYTGQYMSRGAWERRYGGVGKKNEMPDWVMEDYGE